MSVDPSKYVVLLHKEGVYGLNVGVLPKFMFEILTTKMISRRWGVWEVFKS